MNVAVSMIIHSTIAIVELCVTGKDASTEIDTVVENAILQGVNTTL